MASTARQEDLGGALLTLADVRRASGVPPQLVDRPDEVVNRVLDSRNLAVVTPHLCRDAPLPSVPQPEARVAAVFTSSPAKMTITQWVYALEPGRAEDLFAEFRDNMRPGCPPVRAIGPNGPRLSEVLGDVPLPIQGEDQAAASLRLNNNGQVSYGMLVAIRANSNVTYVLVSAPTPIPQAFVTDLAVTAAGKLGLPSA